MNKNYILVSLDEETEKAKAVAEVLSSPTCKKMISYLAEVGNSGASQKDLSDELNIPLNTIDYNIKKLLDSGFVQKRKNFFWSKKGKKIIMYELSNKSILISHKKSTSEKIKSITPAFILTAAGTFLLWAYGKIRAAASKTDCDLFYVTTEKTMAASSSCSNTISPETLLSPMQTPLWVWFLLGSLLAIFVISIVNWRKL